MEFILTNKNGMKVTVDSKGCVIKEIVFDGDNVICTPPYAAAVIGRIAGRISGGKFTLGGVEYALPQNENNNQLHGNHEFDRQADWQGTQLDNMLLLRYLSTDGANGFPGEVDTVVTYTLSEDNTLTINYNATTTGSTIFNLTNHAYFNLNGDSTPIYNHRIIADCEYFVPLKEDLTPLGKLQKVDDSIFDIRGGRLIKNVVESGDSQVALAKNGFDHAFVFTDCKDYNLYTNDKIHEARLICEDKKRIVTMNTDYPCFVCYSGNQMKERPHLGICLEAQLLPDAINHDGFGSIVLEPEKAFSHFVSYKFSTY